MKDYFGKNIKYIRTRYHYTQEQMAAIIGKTYSAISLYEREMRSPSTEDIIALADRFGLTPSDLCFTDLSAPEKVETMMSAEELALLNIFRKLPQNQREAVIQFVNAMVEGI